MDTLIDEIELANAETFSALGVNVGTIITIETFATERKYHVQLLGYSENKSILISAPLRDGKEVLLDKGCSLAVRLLVGKKVCAFEARVLYRSLQPYTYYHLSYPALVEALQVRNSERVDSWLDTIVDCDFDIVYEWPKSASINNLSSTGARLNSIYALGQKGHELILSFELAVSGMKKQITLSCLIRNIEYHADLDERDPKRYVFGVEFIGLTDEHRLTLSNYIYEHN